MNVGPKADGTITDEETQVLKELGEWMKLNGEGIYGTTFWKQFGEGDVNNEEGFFKDREEKAFTEKDFRFTYKCGSIYAFQMRPNGENAVIKALKKHNTHDFIIKRIGLLLLKFSFALIINSLSFLSNLSAALVESSVILLETIRRG